MKREINLSTLLEVIKQVSGKNVLNLQEDDFLIRDLHLASIEIIDMIFELEKTYQKNIQISDFFSGQESSEDFRRDFQVRDVLEILKRKSM